MLRPRHSTSSVIKPRSEEELRKLDMIAEQSAAFAKSVSLKPSVEPYPGHNDSRQVAQVRDAVAKPIVIDSQEQLNALVEEDFAMRVTVRNARTYKFMRVLISPELTDVWDKNTRASETEPDVSDIIDSIVSNGTNIIPAFGQFDDSSKQVQLIAGTRRRFATIKANVFLTMDLYFGVLHEKDKLVIMHIENIRQDPDVFLKCRSYKELIKPTSGTALFPNQSALGQFLGRTREYTNKLIVVGRLPNFVVDKITDRKSITFTRAYSFAKSFAALEQMVKDDFALFIKEVEASAEYRFVELDKILKKYFEEVEDAPKEYKPKVSRTYKAKGLTIIELKSEGKFQKAIELPDVSDDLLDEILNLIKSKLE